MINKTYKSLQKTRNSFFNAFSVITGKKKIDESSINDFEEKLLLCDLGFDFTDQIIKKIKNGIDSEFKAEDAIKGLIKNYLKDLSFSCNNEKRIVMISGVNGSGKTTLCAKLSKYYKDLGKNVSVIGADTFRAAAQEQIAHWCLNNNINFFTNTHSKDPSSVIFEGLDSLKESNFDKIIIDTAGRLHTSINLMNELNKMQRIIMKFEESYNNWISIDSTLGQNSVKQIEIFKNHINIDGIVLNKMDGSAKGGVAIPIMKKYGIPVKFIGTGESVEDIEFFNLDSYLESLF